MNALFLTISVVETLSPELLALGVTWAMVLVGFEDLRRRRAGGQGKGVWNKHA